jgi:hypothetical protein
MSHEQLVNWVLCGVAYAVRGQDHAWAQRSVHVFRDCLISLVNRDHFDPARRDGVMDMDSSRTRSEITTYDSLDESLGQARRNLYLAVKTWAAYVCLETLFRGCGDPGDAARATGQATRAARTIAASALPDGTLPAVLGSPRPARIIPAVEGLVFPWIIGRDEALADDGPWGVLIAALRAHLRAVLTPGVCLFPDHGWKLSSTSDNSWLSKIYLCQFVARRILGLPWADEGAAADRAHVRWLTHPELTYWAWSDQIVAGQIRGSKYYPRGVTATLWLEE